MPAGNDTEAHAAFKAAIESQYGAFQNAEDLIRTHQAGIDPAVRRAGMSRWNQEETEKLHEQGLDKVATKFDDVPEGAELQDFAVRGNTLIGVFELPTGVLVKRITGANDRWKREKAIRPEEAAAHEAFMAEQRVRDEAAKLQAEADQKIAEVAAKENARVQEALAKIREDAAKQVEKAQTDAAKDAEPDTKKQGGGGKSS